jgi:hypothetical protein
VKGLGRRGAENVLEIGTKNWRKLSSVRECAWRHVWELGGIYKRME